MSSAAWIQRVHVAQGFPRAATDTAPTSVFLVVYICLAAAHMTLFQLNRRKGKKFLFNGLCFGFCMSRILTTSLRLSWIYNIQSQGIALAATIFVAAGVLLLFIINLLFAQRILRGLHPHIGWNKAISRAFLVLYALIPALLVAVIYASISSFNTTRKGVAMADLDIQRAASCYFLFISFLPIPIVVFAMLWPRKSDPDHFGAKSFELKAAVVLSASLLLVTGAGFRTGTSFVTWSPRYNDAWWNSKAAFYCFNFLIEVTVVLEYLVLRIDMLFHIPDGAKGPYSYTQKLIEQQAEADEARPPTSSSGGRADMISNPDTLVSEQEKELEKV